MSTGRSKSRRSPGTAGTGWGKIGDYDDGRCAVTPQIVAALVGGAAAGALLTAMTSLFTGWLSHRHEHRRWLHDKRLEAYTAFNVAMVAWTDLLEPGSRKADIDQRLQAYSASETVALLAAYKTARQSFKLLRKAAEISDAAPGEGDQASLHDELLNLSSILMYRQRQDLLDMGLVARIRTRLTIATAERLLAPHNGVRQLPDGSERAPD